MEVSDIKIVTVIIQDVPHVIIRWPNGDIHILNKQTDDMNSINLMGIRGQLLKEIRPLIGTFE